MASNSYSTLILVLLMVVAFYFLILRPQKKRQQALAKMTRELQPGDQVLLGSGLFGTLVSLGTKQAVLEISPGVELTVLKQAIVRRATEADVDGFLPDVRADSAPRPESPFGASATGAAPADDDQVPCSLRDQPIDHCQADGTEGAGHQVGTVGADGE